MLSCREAAVDEVEAAGAEARTVGGKEVHKLGNFVGFSGTASGIIGIFGSPHRFNALAGALRNLVEEPVDERCTHRTGAYGIDSHSLRQKVEGEAFLNRPNAPLVIP